MAIDRNDGEERQTRIGAMLDEFRAAQKQRLVNRGIALRNRTEAARRASPLPQPPPPPDKVPQTFQAGAPGTRRRETAARRVVAVSAPSPSSVP
jgi:hypothetical protein